MPIYPYSFQLPPLNVQDIPNDGAPGEFLGINVGGQLDWLPAGGGGSGDMLAANNLSELTNFATARTNIGLGTASTPTFANLTLTSPSLSSSAPVTISQTWGTTGTYTAAKINVTETATANPASRLLDLQLGGASKAYVDKNGAIYGTGVASGLAFKTWVNASQVYNVDLVGVGLIFAGYPGQFFLPASSFMGWNSNDVGSGSVDTKLFRDGAANTLALRNGAAAQTFNVYGTYTSGTSYERLTLSAPSAANAIIGTNKGSGGGTARGLDLHTDGAARMTITTAGNVGIGTTAPGAKLEVELTGTSTALKVRNTSAVTLLDAQAVVDIGFSDSRRLIFSAAGDTITVPLFSNFNYINSIGKPLAFIQNNVNALTISSGNVGIGTTNPITAAGSTLLTISHAGVPGIYWQNTSAVANSRNWNFLVNGLNFEFQSVNDAISSSTVALRFNRNSGLTTIDSVEIPSSRLIVGGTGNTTIAGNVGIGTTSPTSKLHVAETWNNAGTAFCAIKSVITDTNSAAGSDFLELYSGTSTQPLRMDINKTGQINIYGAWTDASNYERLSFNAPSAANAVIGTNKAGTGTARGLEFQTDGVTRMTIPATTGTVNFPNGISSAAGATSVFQNANAIVFSLTGGTYNGTSTVGFFSPSDGVLRITNNAVTDFNRIQLGGTTDAFPAVARDGAGIKFTGAAAGSTSWIKVPPVAVSALPLAATAGAGARAFVNDALAPTFGSAVTGGGSVPVPVYSTGSAWNVG